MDNFYSLIKKYIKGFQLHYTMSDDDVSNTLTTQIAHRDIYYTDLLKDHILLTRIRSWCKEIHKWMFFWLIIIACFLGMRYIFRMFDRLLSEKEISIIIDAIPLIITALVSFISTIIVVPATIAKFLFNTSEDDNITTLITHTQDHDSIGINFFKERLLAKSNQKNFENLDSDDK